MDSSTQQNLIESGGQATGPVECLGLTFENDGLRREHFLAILREQLKDPEFRKIEGFPIGEDEDILALSDPPYYTACPNPFLGDFIRCYGKPYDPETDDYHREPFAADVSEGKNDPIYNAHSYHTKVPHKAIMRYKLLVIQTALVQSPQKPCRKGFTETNMQFRCSTAYPALHRARRYRFRWLFWVRHDWSSSTDVRPP